MKKRSATKNNKINIYTQKEKFLRGEQLISDHVNLYLQRISERHELNAFTGVLNERALETAQKLDKAISAGKPVGKLAGTVIAIKDNICVRNSPTTCGSKILETYQPPYNATVIDKLTSEDAVLIGKTNMDEFAMGSSTENSYYGVSANPVDTSRVPGGSSGGSAVAVAADLAQVALGSDTGGSIRQPAAFTGIVGLKPTYGRVSRYGLVAFASSLDQIGPLSNSVADSAVLLEVISGKDPMDSTSADEPAGGFTDFLDMDIKGMRIGIPDEYFESGLNPEIRDMIMNIVAHIEKNGAEIHRISLPHTKFGVSTYYIIATAEASSNLARYDGIKYGYRAHDHDDLIETYEHTRNEGFGDEVKRRIMLGTYVLSSGYYDAYYRKAQQVRRLIKNDFSQVFNHVDCIISPTTPTTAFKMGEKTANPLEMYLSDIFTVNANLAGIPALSIPAGNDAAGLPVGLQIMADAFKEGQLFQLGDFIERTYHSHD